MNIGGFQKVSLVDYPGNVSTVIFTQGCNFLCPFCHNPELVLDNLFKETILEDEFFSFLERRVGKIDAVVITGGEPTLQSDLLSFMFEVKNIGEFKIKLDTNGSAPDVLKELIKQKAVDFIAMDIKAPFEKYPLLAGVQVSADIIKESINIITSSNIDYQFRTTFFDRLLDEHDINVIKKMLGKNVKYVVNKYVKSNDKPQLFSFSK